jgi:hypothetical protein
MAARRDMAGEEADLKNPVSSTTRTALSSASVSSA